MIHCTVLLASVWVVGVIPKKKKKKEKQILQSLKAPRFDHIEPKINNFNLRLKQMSLWCKPKEIPGTRQARPHQSLRLIKALSGDTVGKVWPPHIQNGDPNPRGGPGSHTLWSIRLPRRRTGKGSFYGWCETRAPQP